MLHPDLTQRLVEAPEGRMCSSGHRVPHDSLYRFEPVRFFRVTGKGIDGVYCEPCLIVANYVARRRRTSPK